MPKHTRRNTAFVIFGIVIVGSMIFLFQEDIAGQEFDIRIETPLQLTDAGFVPISLPVGEQIIVVEEINCKIKQTTLVYGINNRQLLSLDSAGIQGSPFIRLAFLQGGTGQIEVVAYNVNPKIFCSTSNNAPIEVAIKDMQLTVRANYLTVRNAVLETQQVFGSRLLSFGQGQGEQTLVSFPVQVSGLESQLPDQDFPISLTFEITGKINVNYRDFPNIIYQIPIFRADLETFHTIDIRKQPEVFIGIVTITCPSGQEDIDPSPDSILCKPIDTDKDGYPDITDSCPLEPETFNGFEDLDGCPDTGAVITCSDGSVVTSTSLCPAPVITCESQDDRNCTRALCEADNGVFIEERNIFNQVTSTYCQLDLVKPKCEPDEKLELTTGNIFICVKDPDLQDSDGDGILNGIDACPNEFGVPEFQGCPEPTIAGCPEGFFEVTTRIISGECIANTGDIDGDGVINVNDQCLFEFGTVANNGCPSGVVPLNLQEEILKGELISGVIVTFVDGSTEQTISSFQLPFLTQTIPELVPAQLTGTITGAKPKSIDNINVGLFYVLASTPQNQGITLQSSFLTMTPTVIESSVSKSPFSGSVPLMGETLGTLFDISEAIGTGNGVFLGEAIISAESIVNLGELAGITEGQSRDADIELSISGTVTFAGDSQTERFRITNALITFKDFDILNEVEPRGIICPDGTIEVTDATGKVIRCDVPPPDAPKCVTSERPTPFTCPSKIQCDDVIINNIRNCVEPDDDGDGIPNFRDQCRTLKEDFITDLASGSTPDDGCPVKKGVVCVVLENCKPDEPEDGDIFCSERNPEKCLFGISPMDLQTLLIVAGVGLLIVGVLVFAFRRRRTRVFGT